MSFLPWWGVLGCWKAVGLVGFEWEGVGWLVGGGLKKEEEERRSRKGILLYGQNVEKKKAIFFMAHFGR